MSLLRTLLIIGIIYFAVRFITRYLFPMIVKNAANKVQEDLLRKMDERNQSNTQEGEISIRKKNGSPGRNEQDGEYVDYEEINDSRKNKE